HLRAAEAIGTDISGVGPEDAGAVLAAKVIEVMKRVNIPNGLSGVGYTRDDIPKLVEGTLPQHRVTKLSPRPADAAALAAIFEDALIYW
ncbi:MAG: iron-containing alcohol dehydrogenase, partial [Deltaproteobacteria bacterium]